MLVPLLGVPAGLAFAVYLASGSTLTLAVLTALRRAAGRAAAVVDARRPGVRAVRPGHRDADLIGRTRPLSPSEGRRSVISRLPGSIDVRPRVENGIAADGNRADVSAWGERQREIRSMPEQKPRKPGGPNGHSRRDFLRGSGVAAATAVLTGQAALALDEAQAAEAEPKVLSGTVEITLKVNGQDRSCSVEPRSTLLDTLRHRLDVTGPKRVCDRGQLRRLHGDRRRRSGLFLHHAGRLVPGQDDRDARELRHGRARRAPRLPPERRA